jgi:hypothetical protein
MLCATKELLEEAK